MTAYHDEHENLAAAEPAKPRVVTIVDTLTVAIDIRGIDLLALKKLSLVSHALAEKIGGMSGREQTALADTLDSLIRQIELKVVLRG